MKRQQTLVGRERRHRTYVALEYRDDFVARRVHLESADAAGLQVQTDSVTRGGDQTGCGLHINAEHGAGPLF